MWDWVAILVDIWLLPGCFRSAIGILLIVGGIVLLVMGHWTAGSTLAGIGGVALLLDYLNRGNEPYDI